MSSKASILQSPQASKFATASPSSVATGKAAFSAPLASFASPLPTTQMIASGAHFSTTSRGCAGCGPPSGSSAVFQGSLTMGFDRILHLGDGHSHIFGKCCTRLVELHDSACSVVPAVPGNFIRGRLVQSEAEWRFVLPHLSCHVVPPSQLIGKTVSVRVKDKTTNSAERFCRKELDFGIGVGTHSRSIVFAPMASAILIASPVQCTHLVLVKVQQIETVRCQQ